MRLGWYSRTIIVAVAFWTVGNGVHEIGENQKSVQEMRQVQFSACIENEVAKRKTYDRRPGEDCGAYSQRQFFWIDTPAAMRFEFAQSFLSGLGFALLAFVFYWAFRWIWAGRKA